MEKAYVSREALSASDKEELERVAVALADAAREAILPLFRSTNLALENKADQGFDPVTHADKAAERAMRAILEEQRPEDGILGEEYGEISGSSGLTWVLDPIDGTRSFMSGTPTWGVLIALRDATGPFFGLIDQPYIGERFIGGLGLNTMAGPLGTAALQTRSTRVLQEAVLFSTFPEIGSRVEHASFQAVAKEVKLVRYGLDCYAYALLAAGQIDLVIEAGLSAYDVQAPIAVIEAAGGVVCNWHGRPAHDGGQIIAAATPELMAAALSLLQNARL
jgi:histidinol phosphatase-like enzyme (inositol monophosphatase family)